MTPSLDADSHSVAKECPVLSVTRIYITVFKIITPCCVSWIRQIHPTLISYSLILRSHPHIYQPKGFFCSGLPTKYFLNACYTSRLFITPLKYLTNISNY